MVGEDFSVAHGGGGLLLPPLFNTLVENEDVERQEEKEVDDGESQDDGIAGWGG